MSCWRLIEILLKLILADLVVWSVALQFSNPICKCCDRLSRFSVSTHQGLLGWVGPNDPAEVAEVCRAHLAHVEEGVDAEGGEPLEEQSLRHLSADQGRHLGQQLQEEGVDWLLYAFIVTV